MSIDCPPPSLEILTRKFRVFPSWGKISLVSTPRRTISQVVCTSRRGPDSSAQIQLRPCSVRVEKCFPAPGLFWDVQKVTLQDETVELHYSGVVIHEAIKFESETLVKSLSKSEENCKPSLPQGFHEIDKHSSALLENKDNSNHHLSNVSRINDENYKFRPPGRILGEVNCFKCDRKFQNINTMQKHALTHFRHLYDALPNKEPFLCPICPQVRSRRYLLLRHYALGHRKVLELTDTTSEDWKFGVRKGEEVPPGT